MVSLTRDDILKAKDVKIEKLHIPGWGGDVYVKGMTGAERDKFESGIIQMRGKEQSLNLQNVRAKLCVLTICDADGNRLFTDGEVALLAEKSAVELQKIFAVAQRLSGISQEDVEELAEGLKENPFEDSASD